MHQNEENNYEEMGVDFDEVGTIDNFESVRDDIQIAGLLLPPHAPNLFRYQRQMIDRCLCAEGAGPVKTRAGTFYARTGVNANNPGAGKTVVMLAMSRFPVNPSAFPGNIYSSSLSVIILPPKKRKYVPCSLYLASNKVADNWKRDCDKFFGAGQYFEFGTEGDIVAMVNREHNNFGPKKIVELRPGEFDDFVMRKLTSYKIIIAAERSFQYLIDIFMDIQIDRMVIDEPQDIVITSQDKMKGYCLNEDLDFLLRFGANEGTYYREEPFARFTWLVTATPHLISDNLRSGTKGKNRYFNTWVDRNAPFLRDYINSSGGAYHFPDMIKRYVIKFPNSYIDYHKTGGINYMEPIILKIKKPIQAIAVEEALDESFDMLLQNDDISAIMTKLKIDSPEKIVEGVINELNEQIQELEAKKTENQLGGQALVVYIQGIDAKIAPLVAKIDSVIRKMQRLNETVQTSNVHSDSGDCVLCSQQMIPQPEICPRNQNPMEWANQCVVVCKTCFNPFHAHCMKKMFDISNKTTCPFCNSNLLDGNLLKYSSEGRGDVSVAREEKVKLFNSIPIVTEPHVFNSKLEALAGAIQTKNLQKGLLYLDLQGDDTKTENDIIYVLLQLGFDVRIPSSKTKAQIAAKFGAYAQQVLVPGNSRDVGKELKKFEDSTRCTIWIMRTSKSSSGLNFPFIDFIFCYSKFKQEHQIVGRANRPSRRIMYKYIVLEYESIME